MKLQMIGIDHEKAALDIRSLFSFQRKEMETALQKLLMKSEIGGAVLISTCNRTELYFDTEEVIKEPGALLCELVGAEYEKYGKYLQSLEEEALVDHLFQLSCGMKSRVYGEDQIISQIKDALSIAREAGATDYFMEKLFLGAITVGKKVRSSVRLTAVDSSVVSQMKDKLQEKYPSLKELKCMVIGNGEIGRLAARELKAAGADVLITVRNYKTRQVEIPEGCRVIGYKERYELMADFDVIVSATTSPHHTISYEEAEPLFRDGKKRTLVDLAVPRDIAEELKEIEGVSLYDIDMIASFPEEKNEEAKEQALSLIKEQKESLKRELNVRNYVDKVQLVSQNGGKITYKRIEKELYMAVERGEQEAVRDLLSHAAEKTVSSLIYSLKKVLPQEEWEACVDEIDRKLQVF
jgi:glutamyl-tRNA reductase